MVVRFTRGSRTPDNRGRWLAAVSAVATATVVGLAGAGPAGAEPFNVMAIPEQIPRAIDGTIPAPPYPRLTTIPQRAVTPGMSHRVQELREATLPSPTGDPFFDRWSPALGSMTPGQLIASRDVTRTAVQEAIVPIRSARQVKFATRDATGRPSFGTATVLVPRKAWTGGGPRPIVVNNIPIDALGAACTPGVTLAGGISPATNPTDYLPPTTQLALDRGYTVLIPDHQGPRMAYAEPTVAGHIILDSIRAISTYDADAFGHSRIGMFGYSGGAIATKGAALLTKTYAPELSSRIVGAAFGGVPADFQMLAGSMNANLATGLFHAALFGISRERPELLPLANHLAQWLATSPLKNACSIPAILLGATFWPAQLLSNVADPFHSPTAREIYRITKMQGMKSSVPLYIYNGAQEFWIPAAGARNLFRDQCRLGANATYREVFGEHIIAMATGYPEAMTWLDARLKGHPAHSTC
ncbi:hypothetical protein M2359_000773 [Gordonia amarae]|nr:hypothetical protein [Gordonia amarae]GAB05073.1 putative lipase [Gordonia amarae NBRC 15530]